VFWELLYNKKFYVVNKQVKMCSVPKQGIKQRCDVGWLVLIDDDLSTESARRRQTVETATRHDGTVSEPWRQRPVNGDGVLTVTESAPVPRVVVL